MPKELTPLIDLATAHVTQTKRQGQPKSKWYVRKNITGEDLATLRPTFNEEEVFEILDFARKFELIAFNAGIQFQKKLSNAYYKNLLDGHKRVIHELTAANTKLADKLKDLIGGND
jgi:hypothetical protein